MADKANETAPATASTPAPAPAAPDPRLDVAIGLLMVIARHVTGNLTAETPEDLLGK